MIDSETAYLFRHALLRDAAYQLHMPQQRADLHGEAAELLLELHGQAPAPQPGLEILAHLRTAAETLGQLSDESDGNGQVELREGGRAKALLQREFALLEPIAIELGRRRDLPALLAVRQRQLHHPLQAQQSKGAARLVYAIALRMCGRVPEAESIYRDVLASAQAQTDALLRGRCVAGLATIFQYTGRVSEAETLTLEAIEISRQLQNNPMLAVQLGNYGSLLKETGRAALAVEPTQQAVNLALATGQTDVAYRYMANLTGILVDVGDNAGAIAMGRRCLELVVQWHMPDVEGVCRGNMAAALSATGDQSTADNEFRVALRLAMASGDHRVAAVWASVVALRAIRKRDINAAELVLRQGLASALEANAPVSVARCSAMLTLLQPEDQRDQEQLDETLATLRKARDANAINDILEAAQHLGIDMADVDVDGSANR
ncbi:MAG: hypothetical protein IPP14_04560 [Planctomycetes bacterium]|nr:hypothetical protein [Planctomycetota bacterium]